MSPEQAAGDRDLDQRSDVYSLGCVVYEMLAGQPPFTGPTAESIVSQHLGAPAPEVTTVRPAVSPAIAAALAKAMAKAPADRPTTASQFREALKVEPAAGPRAVARRSPFRLLGVAAAAVLAAIAVVALWPRGDQQTDPQLVAVMPFRVTGPGLEYLREGMVDLLAAKLTGEGGPRAVDQRTVVSAWRRAGGSASSDVSAEEAIEAVQSLGAGRLLLGSVVGTPDRMVLEATVTAVPNGRPVAQARVEGHPDSIHSLVDDLTAELLARQAGEAEQRLAALTSTSLDALKAYLDGQAAYRRGQFEESAERFTRALEIDSTFALAALGLVSAKQWTVGGFDSLGVAIAWRHRDRLSLRDRTQAEWFAGSHYPEPSDMADRFRNLERWLEVAPDRPDAWYWGGEGYYHYGRVIGFDAPHDRAAEYFSKAVELDSSFAAPLLHLFDIAAATGDTAQARQLATRFLRLDPAGTMTDMVRWLAAVVLGDSAGRAEVRARFTDLAIPALQGIMGTAVEAGLALEDGDRVAEVLERRADNPSRRLITLLRVHDFMLARGRPREALRVTAAIGELSLTAPAHLILPVWDAIYAGGDSAAAADAVRELESLSRGERPDQPDVTGAACTTALWRAAHGRYETVAQAISRNRLLRWPSARGASYDVGLMCVATLDAVAAVAADRRDADEALARLDSLVQAGLGSPWHVIAVGALTAARLYEDRGDREAALAAVRRRGVYSGTYLATYLREEGRLAALLGERDAAIRAYEHYLTLMSDPEESFLPEVQQVRAELARLVGEGTGS
jgi:serine/threonine-protein kinase